MKRLLCIGGGNVNGLGQYLFNKAEHQYQVLRISKSDFFSDCFESEVIRFQPDYVLITSASSYKVDLPNIDYQGVDKAFQSRLLPLYKIGALLDRLSVDSVVVISGAASNFIINTYCALSLVNTATEVAVRYLAQEFMGRTRFNYVSPWRVGANGADPEKICVDDVYSAITFLFTNQSINGTGILIDRGFSMNVK
ncbi:hypothetical protein BLL42_05510 [Pseudomonas frederiksbergensis]|uniref:Short chain dehydrogenase n=1 Tax=Pseudomonas frederiksbergensis TaxID=104087 RepID=A0A1J0EH15_9PSED|nr:hypothetical protein [Pseudomonas frederiksbergensis]APC15203.1 hypothetical protein BLL42_05510 [Pseudomonas frederiksbergensis]